MVHVCIEYICAVPYALEVSVDEGGGQLQEVLEGQNRDEELQGLWVYGEMEEQRRGLAKN
jgi:hypothetical protein